MANSVLYGDISFDETESANMFLNSTTILYGDSGSGKTTLTKSLLKKISDLSSIGRSYCWCKETSIYTNSYSIVFGKKKCFSDFSTFTKWYTNLDLAISREESARGELLKSPYIQKILFALLPGEEQHDLLDSYYKLSEISLNEKAKIFNHLMWQKINSNLKFIKDLHFKNKQIGDHSDECIICSICLERRPLILLDDFCEKRDLVMRGKFCKATMQARHSKLTIIICTQSVLSIPTEFASNAQIKIFTSLSMMHMYFSRSSVVMTTTEKKNILDLLGSAKKKFPYAFLLINQNFGNLKYSVHTIELEPLFIFKDNFPSVI